VTVAYHPVTHEPAQTWQEWAAIETALDGHAGSVVVTAGNVDPQGIELRRRQESWCATNPRRRFVSHLGQRHFLALLGSGGCLLGNSSAGIWEAPAVGAPAVNLGRRQEGRLRGANVLDVPKADSPAVSAALRRALDPAFRASLAGGPSPYGDGSSAPRITKIIADLPLREVLLRKRFIDVER
jgi:UDP-N-acetylglucosamine 2-epimerase